MELDELETKGIRSELLGLWVARVAGTGKEIFATDERVALATLFVIFWDGNNGFAEVF